MMAPSVFFSVKSDNYAFHLPKLICPRALEIIYGDLQLNLAVFNEFRHGQFGTGLITIILYISIIRKNIENEIEVKFQSTVSY